MMTDGVFSCFPKVMSIKNDEFNSTIKYRMDPGERGYEYFHRKKVTGIDSTPRRLGQGCTTVDS